MLYVVTSRGGHGAAGTADEWLIHDCRSSANRVVVVVKDLGVDLRRRRGAPVVAREIDVRIGIAGRHDAVVADAGEVVSGDVGFA